MALSVTQYMDFTKTFFTLKTSYGLTVKSTVLKRAPCKPYDILTAKNALLQSVHCVTNSVTCSQQAAAAQSVPRPDAQQAMAAGPFTFDFSEIKKEI